MQQATAVHPPTDLVKETERLANKLWRMRCSCTRALDSRTQLIGDLSQEQYTQAPSNRIMIAIAGIPGAGKTTVGRLVVNRLNQIHAQSIGSVNDGTFAINLPMDGFHYSRAYLAAMPNPKEAIYRRGAAFTFDAEGYYELVRKLREEPVVPQGDGSSSSVEQTVYAPSFDHAVKDPVADDIAIEPRSRVLVFEGNYCALNRPPWSDAAKVMDEIWFIAIDRNVARERLVKRHVASGICPDEAFARHRVDSTDSLNAEDVLANLLPVQETICE